MYIAQPIFVKIDVSRGKKVSRKFTLHTSAISQKVPKVNNHPIGDNWANLVTLGGTSKSYDLLNQLVGPVGSTHTF
jgi:hypothetical protein